MNTKDIKLIAMDMDGTLLNENKEISKESREALQEAVSSGISIAICSGRSSGDNSIYAVKAGLTQCYIIGYNGAYCLDAPHGKVYSQHFFNRDAALACLKVLDQHGVSYACFQPHRILAVENERWPAEKGWVTYRDEPGAPQVCKGHAEVKRAHGEGINKILCVERHEEKLLKELYHKLLPIPGIDVTCSWTNNLELMPAGVNKGTALGELANRLGLLPENVMALGDFDNDIPMFLYAGCSVAMGNASERLKKVARFHTATNAREGVALAIRQYAL